MNVRFDFPEQLATLPIVELFCSLLNIKPQCPKGFSFPDGNKGLRATEGGCTTAQKPCWLLCSPAQAEHRTQNEAQIVAEIETEIETKF